MELFDEDEDINIVFSNLTSIDSPEDGKVWLLCTSKGAMLFSTYDSFESEFFEEYVTDCTPWDTLADTDLEEWIERTRSEFDGIPCSEYEE